MSWMAENIGEFNTSNLSFATWDNGGYDNERSLISLEEGMLCTRNYFHFHSPNDRLDISLKWFPKTRKCSCVLVLRDLETEEETTYTGDIELSTMEPSRYMWYVFQRCFEITHGSRMTSTTASVKGGYTLPTDKEMDEIEAELGLGKLK